MSGGLRGSGDLFPQERECCEAGACIDVPSSSDERHSGFEMPGQCLCLRQLNEGIVIGMKNGKVFGVFSNRLPIVGRHGECFHWRIKLVAHHAPHRSDEKRGTYRLPHFFQQPQSEGAAQAVTDEDTLIVQLIIPLREMFHPLGEVGMIGMWKVRDDDPKAPRLQLLLEPRKPVFLCVSADAVKDEYCRNLHGMNAVQFTVS